MFQAALADVPNPYAVPWVARRITGSATGASRLLQQVPPFQTRCTISFFVRPDWNSGDGTRRAFFSQGSSAATPEFAIQRFTDNNVYAGFAGTQRAVISDAGLFVAGQWGHFLYEYDNTAPFQRTYWNNRLLVTNSNAFTTAPQVVDLTVGNLQLNAGANANLLGSVALLAKYNRLLTPGERAALAERQHPFSVSRNGLVFCFQPGTPDLDLVSGRALELYASTDLTGFSPAPQRFARRRLGWHLPAPPPPAGTHPGWGPRIAFQRNRLVRI